MIYKCKQYPWFINITINLKKHRIEKKNFIYIAESNYRIIPVSRLVWNVNAKLLLAWEQRLKSRWITSPSNPERKREPTVQMSGSRKENYHTDIQRGSKRPRVCKARNAPKKTCLPVVKRELVRFTFEIGAPETRPWRSGAERRGTRRGGREGRKGGSSPGSGPVGFGKWGPTRAGPPEINNHGKSTSGIYTLHTPFFHPREPTMHAHVSSKGP